MYNATHPEVMRKGSFHEAPLESKTIGRGIESEVMSVFHYGIFDACLKA